MPSSDVNGSLRSSIREAVTIVLSILLAFGIDAAWDARRERSEERELLAALQEDFGANAAEVSRIVAAHRRASEDLDRFLAITPTELSQLSQPRLDSLGLSLAFPLTFDPVRGTLDAILNSGSLEVIRDRALRTDLTTFLNLVEDLEEDATYVRETALAVWNAQVEHGGPWSGVTEVDLAALTNARRDDRLMGLVRLHREMRMSYLDEFEGVVSATESVLARLN